MKRSNNKNKQKEQKKNSCVGDCCWLVDRACRSPASPSPPRQTRQLRRPMTSWQRRKPRPPQVRTTNRRLITRLLFMCPVWHLFCLFLTALTRITSCCEEPAERLRKPLSEASMWLLLFLQPPEQISKLPMKDHTIVFCDLLRSRMLLKLFFQLHWSKSPYKAVDLKTENKTLYVLCVFKQTF